MFRQEKVFVGTDVQDREALCRRLTDNGATLVAAAGDPDVLHILNTFEGVCILLSSLWGHWCSCVGLFILGGRLVIISRLCSSGVMSLFIVVPFHRLMFKLFITHFSSDLNVLCVCSYSNYRRVHLMTALREVVEF